MNLVTATGIVFARQVRPELRSPLGLVLTMMEPLVFLVFFGPLLAGLPGVGAGSPWQWFVPGILVMLALFGASGAGYTMITELATGSFERMMVTPLNRAAIMIGHTMKHILILLAQAALIVLVVMPFGFRLHPAGVAAGLLLLVTLGVGLGSLSLALAIAARRQPALFWSVQQFALFPLLLLSGVLLPMENAPSWLAVAAQFNPLRYVVEATRSLFAGDLLHPSVPPGLLAAAAIAALGVVLGTLAMRRASL
ncbi:ABC transporter [Microtetraspora sp. NBRC 13810]|uniref:ABC transporter permease n=1 Tax=Microtetraspora sp. NBRC 13810 TaxID=3030990 RepID=UPI0024A58DF0|nr:ABC transporter permease [Microtetraspora sp. NBRC 13810]GLW06275.1 ABC transporter [Microtetraspora sp. NBRC 13810]